jgi:formylglycine-generating enzyme required for sulfatase activity
MQAHSDPDMQWISGGTVLMGSDRYYPEEAPTHTVEVADFWIDRYLVTNAQFAQFVQATGYRTVAEQAPDPTAYPGADPALLVPASLVFVAPDQAVPLDTIYRW